MSFLCPRCHGYMVYWNANVTKCEDCGYSIPNAHLDQLDHL